jgi:outer membrane lipoprotein SlyB
MKRRDSETIRVIADTATQTTRLPFAHTIPVALIVLLLLSACASDKAIIDRRGVDMKQYAVDYADCQSYAEEVDNGSQIAKSAGVGAVVGGTVGAIFGNSGTAIRGVGAGAVQGGVAGGLRADRQEHRVVLNCLRGRGYKVLN